MRVRRNLIRICRCRIRKFSIKLGVICIKNVAYDCSGEQSCVFNDICVQSTVLSGLPNAVLDTPPATSDYSDVPLHCDSGLLARSAGTFRFVFEITLLLVQDV